MPRGSSPQDLRPDPYLVASRLASDSVVAYHAALQLHGKAHSLSRRFTYLTATRVKPFLFQGSEFLPVPVPPPLRNLPEWGGGIVARGREGLEVRVTTLERTLVDVLHSLPYSIFGRSPSLHWQLLRQGRVP